jgi:hypothetical protein
MIFILAGILARFLSLGERCSDFFAALTKRQRDACAAITSEASHTTLDDAVNLGSDRAAGFPAFYRRCKTAANATWWRAIEVAPALRHIVASAMRMKRVAGLCAFGWGQEVEDLFYLSLCGLDSISSPRMR